MIENFLLVGQNVLVLFILILIGVITQRFKVLDQNSINKMTDFVLIFVTPCIIIKSFQRELNNTMVKGLFTVFIVGICVHIISIIISLLLVKDKDDNKSRVFRFGVVFGNCGFMSLPIQQALLGDEGIFYGSIYVSAFTIIVWTFGYALMGGGMKSISIKKLILNPGIIGVTIGILLATFSIKLPMVINKPIEYLSYLNTPLPMVIIGFYIAQLDFKNLFNELKVYVVILLRLVVVPVITIGILLALNVKGIILIVCAIAASAPTAAITVMFSNKFNRDTKLAAQLVSIATLVSIITMPIIIGLAQYYS